VSDVGLLRGLPKFGLSTKDSSLSGIFVWTYEGLEQLIFLP